VNVLVPILGLLLLQQQDVSLLLEHATPPNHPLGTQATGISVFEVEIDGRTGTVQTRQLYGRTPFIAPGANALMSWAFAIPPGTSTARTTVTFLFRSPAIYSVPISAPSVRPWAISQDMPALPQEVVDPGYPHTSVAQGVVVFVLRINANGAVIGVEKFSGDDGLFNQAVAAMKKWKFSPARIDNKPVDSTAYAVISFVRPT
jgi:hypothetical protein